MFTATTREPSVGVNCGAKQPAATGVMITLRISGDAISIKEDDKLRVGSIWCEEDQAKSNGRL